MRRADRERWQSAQTLADLGELTAQWLEGAIQHHPAYDRPDRETRPLVQVLASLNRCGFVTASSQPGRKRDGRQQWACVEGFTDSATANSLIVGSVGMTGLAVLSQPVPNRAVEGERWSITTYNDEPCTLTGPMPIGDFDVQDVLAEQVKKDLAAARYVVIADHEGGRNDRLWPALAEWARPTDEFDTCGGDGS